MITLTDVHADHGSIVQFEGTDEDGADVLVAVDHRPAQDIADALAAGEEVVVEPEDWQIRWL